ncbi:DUF2339 domain-containing protein [Chelatococcus reniformis]|uniref:Membrane protein n=1 Tax=Chelatococcus reniformis TaxID=1494448 RepID=A0A916U7F7_9HYPH|nr:DUF2339 domain-containing protein [Chelatococcus reniformis]GGC61943.1 membrane protein [Chelatococcus reniformis]
MEYILLGLVILALPFAGLAAIIMVLNLRRHVRTLEQRLDLLERRATGPAPSARLAAAEPAAGLDTGPPPTAPPPQDARPSDALPAGDDLKAPEPPAPAGPPERESPKAAPHLPRMPGRAASPPPAPPLAGTASPTHGAFEDRLGGRWAVWVGGVALALGAVLMVRYSIEQGYFGPGARIVCAALFATALLAGGEWFRRREPRVSLPGLANAYVPGVLTAAGTVAAFATGYGAHALYGFIGPAAAFVLLGAIALATMFASALHGPALAALGLVGALATPLLVASDDPQPWPLVLYLAFLVAAAYALARVRLWRWLALAAAIGASLWGLLLVLISSSADLGAVVAFVVSQTALSGLFLVADPHRGIADADARLDRFALPVLAALAILGVLAAELSAGGGARAAVVGLLALMQLTLALRFSPVSPAALLAAGMGAATLALWPVAELAARVPSAVLPSAAAPTQLPAAIGLYLAFTVGLGLVLLAGPFWRLRRGRALTLPVAAPYVAAPLGGPMLLLVISYWRVTAFDTSVPFAAVAGVLALLLAFAAGVFKRETAGSPALALALGASAAGAVGALALGLTFMFAQGTLTVSFAVTALAAAWIARRSEIPALRYAVGALGALVLARLVWDPVLVGNRLGSTPIFNWLLWGYGVPALAFGLAARLLAERRRDLVVSLCEGLAILFSFGLMFFELRHAFQGGDPLARTWGLAEAGTVAAAALAFAAVLLRTDRVGSEPIRRYGALAAGLVALAIAVEQLLTTVNPLLGGATVAGGAIFNTLLPGYLLPALAAAALAFSLRTFQPSGWARAAACAALVLQFMYAIAEVRRLFQGPDISLARPTGSGELWAYSLVLLAIGVLALAVGLLRDIRFARLLSAVYVTAAVLKVFLLDLASLEGMLRALSFIGLGVVLVGIGLAYQKLLVRRPPPQADPPGDTPKLA